MPHPRETHGHTSHSVQSVEYTAWCNMKARCYNPNYIDFARYGGRGIIVCSRWMVFENFFADMGIRPSEHHSLDRINSDGNYEPSNCRWATTTQQTRNRKSNIIIEGKCLIDHCREMNFPYHIAYSRYRKGYSSLNDIMKRTRNYGTSY